MRRDVAELRDPGDDEQRLDAFPFKEAIRVGAKGRDFVWIMLMGNDAMDLMPDCAAKGESAAACGDELYATVMTHMRGIVEAVHEANPTARIVGFGYDTMFGGLGCGAMTRSMFPQCYKVGGGGNRCFNTEFLRMQEAWHDLAGNYSYVTETSILGVTQVAGGDANASTGPDRHIDMDKMGPAKYWPDWEGCVHPGVLFGGDKCGAMIVMEEFYREYWATALGC